jgi:hypothetical protein
MIIFPRFSLQHEMTRFKDAAAAAKLETERLRVELLCCEGKLQSTCKYVVELSEAQAKAQAGAVIAARERDAAEAGYLKYKVR